MVAYMKKFEIAYLHIGLDKTGTTAIQSACNHNQAMLEESGVLYPELYPQKRWHAPFGSYFLDDPKSYIWQKERRSTKEIAEVRKEDEDYISALNKQLEISTANRFILSYEGFSMFQKRRPLEKIQKYLAEWAESTVIIMYCREPISYAVSGISQQASSGQLTSAYPKNPPFQSFKRICSDFEHVFGFDNLIVREFKSENFLNKDVRNDFFLQLGLDEDLIDALDYTRENSNSSITKEAIKLACAIRNLNGHMSSGEFRKRYRRILESIKGSKYVLNQQQYKRIIRKSRPHVEYLSKNFNINFEPVEYKTLDEDNDSSNRFFDALAAYF